MNKKVIESLVIGGGLTILTYLWNEKKSNDAKEELKKEIIDELNSKDEDLETEEESI